VLHYHYNSIHDTHVHADNEASYGTFSSFTTSSVSQVKTVQAVCRYIFYLGTTVDGIWGSQTDSHSRTVLSYTGWGGGIRDSQANWHRFCGAGQRGGYDLSLR
jgi:hypothetical protein